jgi:hypothetical protein
LDAIRKAGGSKGLKNTGGEEKRKERKKKEAPPPATGGDFMTDLFSRIQRRREGISGSKTPGGGDKSGGGNQGGTSAMDNISKLIPPAKDRRESTGHFEDDDWE